MVRKLVAGALVVAGLSLIVVGVQKWLDNQAAAEVVHAFMNAVKKGDRETALSLLQPQQRALVERRRNDEQDPFRTPEAGVTFRIHHIEISGVHARAQLWIEKEGFVVQPTIHLHRSETGRWKIGVIENLQIDPRWEDLQQERGRATDERLATELGDALKVKPGVTVQRVPLDEFKR